jgi:DNA-binding Lrp family transcriptional regulator
MAPHALGFVLVRTSSGEALSAVDGIKDVKGVNTAYAVTGEYDIICLVEAEDVDGLASTVVDRIQQVSGVERTETALAVHGH